MGVFFRRGRLLPCLCLQHSPRGHTVDLEQLTTSVASGQRNSDDTATRDPRASSLGHRRYPHRAVDSLVRLRVDYAFSCLRWDDEGWVAGWRSQLSWSASRRATLVSDLYPARQKKSPRHSHEKALGSDQHSWPDQRAFADHLNGPWYIICIQEGRGFVTGSSLDENVYIANQHHCAVLLNKNTFASDFSRTPLQIPCTHTYASWTVEGMVVTGKFRRAPDPSCSFFTIANVQINNECAKR